MNDNPFAPIGSPSGAAPRKRAASEWRCVLPVPTGAPKPPIEHPKLGKPATRWEYRDASGRLLGFACRFNTADGKQFRPLALFEPQAGGKSLWRWEAWPALRPLYGLDALAAMRDATVIVTEGEKAADAARRLLPTHVAITSPNGSKSADKADWSPLRGRTVNIWPDADDAGKEYAAKVAALARKAGAGRVAVASPPPDAAAGWDAADAETDGWGTDRARAFINAAARWEPSTTSDREADKEGGRRRQPQRDGLMALTTFCDLWHSPRGDAYVTYPVKGHRENWPVRSQQFKRWLASRAYEETGLVPGAQALEDTVRVLEARACNEGPSRTPWLRVGRSGEKAYIDLCDYRWRCVEITPIGWRVVEKSDAPFIRTQAMLPLPEPEAGYEISEARRFLNVADDDSFTLTCSWLIASLTSQGPYPILVVNGEQGSGKSTFSRAVRSLVDPNEAPIRSAPKDERDLIIAAVNAHVIGMDNLSRVEPSLADGLCRLSTGGGFATRALHTDGDEFIWQGQRPIILNGIPQLTDRPDLAERSITIRLRAIPDIERRPESEFWQDWENARPRLLGSLLDAFARGLKDFPDMISDWHPRMADFAKWSMACEPGFGWEVGTFKVAYTANRTAVADASFEADPVANAVVGMLASPAVQGRWEGSAADLLASIADFATDAVKRSRRWPQSPQAVGNALDRAAPLLRGRSVEFERHKSGVRTITLWRKGE